MAKPLINRKPKDPAQLWDYALELLRPLIIPTLALLPNPEFTTREFIMYLRATNPGEDAYTQAVSAWKDNLTLGRQTVHGQIIPQLLREEAKASWAGYVYNDQNEEDGLSVPSRWLKPGYTYSED
ncbi:MAG TPA: hypothetical protein VH186_25850 [Chloroflexia bacterium]|nr:hypothetical protein [Chloroflexia bacterium]